jgi:hypothetical protein
MIPSDDEVLAMVPSLRVIFHVDADLSRAVVAAALEEARGLASDPRDAAAAVFYAFGRRAHVLRGWWRVLTDLLALHQVRTTTGTPLAATANELRALRVAVASRGATFDDVRQFFDTRIVPPP